MNSSKYYIRKLNDSIVDIQYAKRLLVTLGEDVSSIKDDWCYKELIEHYGSNNKLINKIKEYFIKYDNLNIVYTLYCFGAIEYEWIEYYATSKSSSQLSYLLVMKHGADKKLAENIIEENKNSCYAYLMTKYCGSDREWAEKIIKYNNNSKYAYFMVRDCGSSSEWLESFFNYNK